MASPQELSLSCCADCGKVRFDTTGHCSHCRQREADAVPYVPKSWLTELQASLQVEVERLRDEAAACRDEAIRRPHKGTADLALGEGAAIDRRADRLETLLAESRKEET
jgi:hypothetical protein